MIQSILNYGNWYEYTIPFKHYRAENVLDEGTYQKIEANFNAVSTGQVSRTDGYVYQLERFGQNYDAHMLGMDSELAELFKPFFSVDFLKAIAQFLNIPFIYQIDGGLHSSQINSRTGWIHNDLCHGWFDSNFFKENALTFPTRYTVDYFTGNKNHDSAAPQKFARAATLIFYLGNNDWKKGEGGETGLYGASHLTNDTVVDFIAPINNSLLLFECSPHSYHRFITNPGRIRNSLILWLHSTPEIAVSKWPNAL